MSRYRDFAAEHYAKKDERTANEEALRKAIDSGEVKPDMSLREIGKAIGISSPQLIRHYLTKFLKEDEL